MRNFNGTVFVHEVNIDEVEILLNKERDYFIIQLPNESNPTLLHIGFKTAPWLCSYGVQSSLLYLRAREVPESTEYYLKRKGKKKNFNSAKMHQLLSESDFRNLKGGDLFWLI